MIYKLNLHAHTRYSDGYNSLYEMVFAYKHMGYQCAVITDHHYITRDLTGYSMSADDFECALKKAASISQLLNFPVIVGCEYSFFGCEEVLCFGTEFIRALLKDDDIMMHDFRRMKEENNGACVLCHPKLRNNDFLKIGGHTLIEGYEAFNSSAPYFEYREIPDEFKGLLRFSNSDAHKIEDLISPDSHKSGAYNAVKKKINDEIDLIDMLKNGQQYSMFAYGKVTI